MRPSGRRRLIFRPVILKLAVTRGKFCREHARPAHPAPNQCSFGNTWLKLVNISATSADVTRNPSNSRNLGPASLDIYQDRSTMGRHRPTLCQNWSTSLDTCRHRPKLVVIARNWWSRPKPVEAGRNWSKMAGIASNLAHIAQTWPEFGLNLGRRARLASSRSRRKCREPAPRAHLCQNSRAFQPRCLPRGGDPQSVPTGGATVGDGA